MAPKKKAQKISLNEFLTDTTSGSWADEMDSLPSAPAMREDDGYGSGGDRFGRRGDDFLSSRPDRASGPPREDLPLPTGPPYTAFIGNLSFDLTEAELEDFFSTSQTKTIKIIKDRDDKPKGFGYVEFETLDGLKDALAKTGSPFAGRTIRVSVAEPPKERSGFGGSGGGFDDGKFDNPWRRDGPLPDLPEREGSRRPSRFDSPRSDDRASGVSDGPSDWRSMQPPRAARAEPSAEPRRRVGFPPSESLGAADTEQTWSKGSKFKPSEETSSERRFGAGRGRGGGEMGGPPAPTISDESDWRSSRPALAPPARQNSGGSPTGSTPPTPQLARRKLELLPRTGSNSPAPGPLGSPKTASTPTSRSNPFGAAKPVDVTSREREVAERVEKERESLGKATMSRTSSRTGSERPPISRDTSATSPTPSSPASASSQPKLLPKANVRSAVSFASAAQGKTEEKKDDVDQVTDKVSEVTV